MAEVKQTNWADDDDYESEEADNEFGLDAAAKEAQQRQNAPV
jgi:hypothetical protein